MVVKACPSSALPGTFSPQAGRRKHIAPFLPHVAVAHGTFPLPACGERVRVRGTVMAGIT